MMAVSSVSLKTMRNTGTEKTLTAMAALRIVELSARLSLCGRLFKHPMKK